MSEHFAQFLEALPPDGPLTPCSAEAIAPYRNHADDGLLRLWTELGWGSFGNGLIHVVDPASLADELAAFLGSSHPTRIYGPLAAHECFGFVPALALGGSEDLSCVRKVDMRVHLSLLSQM